MLLSPLLPGPARTSAWSLWKLLHLRTLLALNQHQQAHKDILTFRNMEQEKNTIEQLLYSQTFTKALLFTCILDKCIVNQFTKTANFQFLKNQYKKVVWWGQVSVGVKILWENAQALSVISEFYPSSQNSLVIYKVNELVLMSFHMSGTTATLTLGDFSDLS